MIGDVVVTIEAELVTPMLPGSADPRRAETFEAWTIRPSTVKGLWRWWARAAIAGAMYDQGLLGTDIGGGLVARPNKASVEAISALLGEVGLGTVVGKASQAAYQLRIETSNLSKHQIGARQRHRLHAVTLLTLGGGLDMLDRARVRIELVELRDNPWHDLAAKTLILALILGGVGKANRKALGSLRITRINNGPANYCDHDPLRRLLEDVYRRAEELVRENRTRIRREGQRTQIPPMPVLSKSKLPTQGRLSHVAEVRMVNGVSHADLHNFYIRSSRVSVLTGSLSGSVPNCPVTHCDDLRRDLNAWVLGLPRAQRGTGYTARMDRRAKTIITSMCSDNRGTIATLVSADWPSEVEWRGAGKTLIRIDMDRIVSAFDEAVSELEQYVFKLGGSVTMVWP